MGATVNKQDVLKLAEREWKASKRWYKRTAFNAIMEGSYKLIYGRTDQDVYLVRIYPTKRTKTQDLDPQNRRLLHFFPRGDDDFCLHDHPWDFEAEILQGGYVEHLPPKAWFDTNRILGPAWNERMEIRVKGDKIAHHAADLHCVGAVHPDTWTEVRTRKVSRDWGFHPPGEVWQPAQQYLDSKVKQLAMEHA